MNSFNIALKNFRHNIRSYGMYLISMILAIAVYYNFIALQYNPQVVAIKELSNTAKAASNSTSFVMLIFLFFFIWYSNSFFINQRKKEIGIYAFMGVSNLQIALVFTIESFFMGLIAIAAGLVFGVLFCKLFMMLLAKVALLNIRVTFFLSMEAFLQTVVVFIIIFAFVGVKGYFDISRSKLIDLFNSLRKEESLPKANYFKGVSSLLIIALAYYISIIVVKRFDVLTCAIPIISLVIWGTYWLFGSLLSIIVVKLLKNKDVLYNGLNVISISNFAFRIKGNYRTLSAIAVLVACTVTAFGTVTSLRYYVGKMHNIDVPYSYAYVSGDDKLNEKVISMIKEDNRNILKQVKVNFFEIDKLKEKARFWEDKALAVSFSDFKKITETLDIKDKYNIIKKIQPQKGELTFIQRPSVVMGFNYEAYNSVNLGGINFNIKTGPKTPIFGKGINLPCLIINDIDYERLSARFKEQTFNGIIIDNPGDTAKLSDALWKMMPEEAEYMSYYHMHLGKYDPIGLLYFLGAFMSLVFVFATGSIIYFKLLSEALLDKRQFNILMKIGVTKDEVKSCISRQIGLSFILPLVTGSIHSMFAIRVLSELMNYGLIIPTAVSIGAFAVIYGLFYILTLRKYMNIVCE